MRLPPERTQRLILVGLVVILYIVAFVPLYQIFDRGVASLSLLPVFLVGAMFGTAVGAIGGVLFVVLTTGLLLLAGAMPTSLYGQVAAGLVGLAGVGAFSGRMHDLGEELKASARLLEGERARLQRELVAREDYTGVVVHELRNPLIAIGAATRVMASNATNEATEQKLSAVSVEAARALELLDGLNDVSSIESGRMRSVLRPVDLNTVVRTGVDAMQGQGHPISLRPSSGPVVVMGDERRLIQVIRNLVGNAAKYSPDSSPIEVTIGLAADRRSATVRVRDYGPGIPPAEREKLFQKFARLTTAGGTSGSGLGLFISRGIVRDHNGTLEAEWPAGGGMAVTMTLPPAA